MFSPPATAPSAALLQQASETLALYERARRERPSDYPRVALSRKACPRPASATPPARVAAPQHPAAVSSNNEAAPAAIELCATRAAPHTQEGAPVATQSPHSASAVVAVGPSLDKRLAPVTQLARYRKTLRAIDIGASPVCATLAPPQPPLEEPSAVPRDEAKVSNAPATSTPPLGLQTPSAHLLSPPEATHATPSNSTRASTPPHSPQRLAARVAPQPCQSAQSAPGDLSKRADRISAAWHSECSAVPATPRPAVTAHTPTAGLLPHGSAAAQSSPAQNAGGRSTPAALQTRLAAPRTVECATREAPVRGGQLAASLNDRSAVHDSGVVRGVASSVPRTSTQRAATPATPACKGRHGMATGSCAASPEQRAGLPPLPGGASPSATPRLLPPLHEGPAPVATPPQRTPRLYASAHAPPPLLALDPEPLRAHKRKRAAERCGAPCLRSESFVPFVTPHAQLQAAAAAPGNAARQRGAGAPRLPALPQLSLQPAAEGLRGVVTGANELPTLSAALRGPAPYTGRRTPRRRRPLSTLLSLSPLQASVAEHAADDSWGEEFEGAAALLQLATAAVPEDWSLAAVSVAAAVDSTPGAHLKRAMHCSAAPPRTPGGGAMPACRGLQAAWVAGWWELRVEWRDLGVITSGAAGGRASHGDVQVARYATVDVALESLRASLALALADAEWALARELRTWAPHATPGDVSGADYRIARESCSETWYIASGSGRVHEDDVAWAAAAWPPGRWCALAQSHHYD